MTSVHAPTYARSRRRWLAATVSLTTAAALATFGGVASAQTSIGLGTAGAYALLAGEAITNTGPSTINGDIGLSPGTAVDGFDVATVNGATNAANPAALQAKSDLTIAYNTAAGLPLTPVEPPVGTELGNRTFLGGTYGSGAPLGLTGAMTLDAQGKSDTVFIFKTASTLTTASNSSVRLVNGANPCNVFWQVGSSATLGTSTAFVGTVMALTSITLDNGATVRGRMLARNGSVTLDNNTITTGECSEPTESSTPTSSPTPEPTDSTTSPSTSVPTDSAESPTPATTVPGAIPLIPIPIPIPLMPPGDGSPAGPDAPGEPPAGPGQPPAGPGQPPAGPGQPPADAGHIVPLGYPDTGAGGTSDSSDLTVPLAALAAMTLAGVGLAAALTLRLRRRQG